MTRAPAGPEWGAMTRDDVAYVPDGPTLADRYDTDPPLRRRPPVRRLGDPTDDARLPIPFYGGTAA